MKKLNIGVAFRWLKAVLGGVLVFLLAAGVFWCCWFAVGVYSDHVNLAIARQDMSDIASFSLAYSLFTAIGIWGAVGLEGLLLQWAKKYLGAGNVVNAGGIITGMVLFSVAMWFIVNTVRGIVLFDPSAAPLTWWSLAVGVAPIPGGVRAVVAEERRRRSGCFG